MLFKRNSAVRGGWKPIPNGMWEFFSEYKPLLRHLICTIFHHYLSWYPSEYHLIWSGFDDSFPFDLVFIILANLYPCLCVKFHKLQCWVPILVIPRVPISLKFGSPFWKKVDTHGTWPQCPIVQKCFIFLNQCCVQVVFFKWDPSKRKAWVALLSGAQGYYYCQTLFSFAFFIWKNNRI